jgi:hypothetical protein
MKALFPPSPAFMTAPEATTPVAAKPAALWEDFIEIFTSPSTVYERRRNANPWPMILIITVLMTVITFMSFNSLAPVYESELRATMAKQMASNPQMTQDAIDTGVRIQMVVRRWTGLFFPLGILVIGLIVWALGRLTGAKELTYTRSLVVVAWGSIFGLLATLLLAVQGLVMDVSTITSADKLSLGVARFLDKDTTPAFLYGASKLIDPLQIWGLIVMAIGVRVVGRGTKNTTIAFAAIWLGVGMLIAGVFAWRATM